MTGATAGAVRYRAHFHHADRAALVAFDPHDGTGIGAARYIRLPHDPESAEVAVEVVDESHGEALANELLSRLAAHAHAQGITRFACEVPQLPSRQDAG
jgi:RimJ/RimL family protein N-acetyltransferase